MPGKILSFFLISNLGPPIRGCEASLMMFVCFQSLRRGRTLRTAILSGMLAWDTDIGFPIGPIPLSTNRAIHLTQSRMFRLRARSQFTRQAGIGI
jgi:hypothetical protein